MVITRLEIRRFRRFREARFDFKPGLNIVRGPNEAGKTTLRSALLAALFGNPTSVSEATQRWVSWGESEKPELRLELNAGQRRLQLRKDFSSGKIFLLDGEETFRTPKLIQDRISELLGVPGEELFSLCADLDVRLLANLGSAAGRKQIGKMLAGLMTGASSGDNVLEALRRLEEGVKELEKGLKQPAKVPGPLKAAEDRYKQLTASKSELEKSLASREQRIREYERIGREVEKSQIRLQHLDRLMLANRNLAEARKRRAELISQEEQLVRLGALHRQHEAELERVRAEIEKNPVRRFSAAERRSLEETQSRMRDIQAQFKPAPATEKSGVPWLVSGGVLVVAGAALWFASRPVALVFWLAAALALAAGWRPWRRNRQRQRIHAANQLSLTREFGRLNDAMTALVQTVPGLDADGAVRALAPLRELEQRLDALEQQAKNFIPPDVEREKELRRELRLMEDRLADPDLCNLALGPDELVSRQLEQKQLAGRAAELAQEKQRLKNFLELDKAGSDEIARCEEELTELRGRLAHLKQRDKILRLTHEWLDKSRRDVLSPARQVLEQRAGELVRAFSRGKYQTLAINDEDLSSRLLIPETSKWENPEMLSQGTFDQFYLGLRLALSEILSNGKNPPLLLDEPFSAFDPEREAATWNCLKEIAKERQIFIFTCHPWSLDGEAHQILLE